MAGFAAEPVTDVGDDLANVFFFELELGEIANRTALVKVGGIDEVPAGLPAATLGFDFVGECSTLNERVVIFKVGKCGVN